MAKDKTKKVTKKKNDTVDKKKLDDCQKQLEEAQQSTKDNWDKVLRTQAEIENLKRRQTIELEKAHKYALDKFVKELLSVSDSMKIGLKTANETDVEIKTIIEGVVMTDKLLSDIFKKFGIAEINPVNEVFNPEMHEAVTIIPIPDKKSNDIVEVVQIGYTLNDRLVRPAMVVVAQ
ncbi:Heat shock protein GrpE [hydrothermal vent metagenome]|uniref:Heat shock protein GrpE n=1 Tax=hydrothermal vent metagenome TaxID=652676 RepID=A0A1W1C448_9ZZZZ